MTDDDCSIETLKMMRERLKLALYAMANSKPAATLNQEAHRVTARRLIEELLSDVEHTLTERTPWK